MWHSYGGIAVCMQWVSSNGDDVEMTQPNVRGLPEVLDCCLRVGVRGRTMRTVRGRGTFTGVVEKVLQVRCVKVIDYERE